MTTDADVAHTTAPLAEPLAGAGTVGGMALAAADRRHGDALTAPGRQPVTYAELGRAVREIAGGLAALGIERGDHVAILANTRPEWTLADLGTLCAGAIVVPIYQTNSPEECEYVLEHAGARAIFCEDAGQVAKVAQVRERCPALEHVIVIDGSVRAAHLREGPLGRAQRRCRAGDGASRRSSAGPSARAAGRGQPRVTARGAAVWGLPATGWRTGSCSPRLYAR